GITSLAHIAYAMMFSLFPLYVKERFGLTERHLGLLMATNAVLIVMLQYVVTWTTRRFHATSRMVAGCLLFAVGVGSVAWGASFPAFVGSMAVVTFGEMIVFPTSAVVAFGLAPPDMRGRYMSMVALTGGVGYALGPVLGGWLCDRCSPPACFH